MFKHWIVEDYLWLALFVAITIAGWGVMFYVGTVSLEGVGWILALLCALNLWRGFRMLKQGRFNNREGQE